MKNLAVLTLLIIAIDAIPRTVLLKEWELFKTKYDKTYISEAEELSRLKLFASNFRKIQYQNKRFLKGKSGFSSAINYFADMTESERAAYRGYTYGKTTRDGLGEITCDTELPEFIDWRKKGAVTAVKNQGLCGCCWAFSAVASLESHHYIATGELISLSEQNLMDCSRSYGNMGCDGGLMQTSFTYIKDNGGIDSEESYPYQEIDCYYCRFKPKYNVSTCNGFFEIPVDDEKALECAVAFAGPVSVAIDSSTDLFNFYESGLYYDPCCSADYLDHGVVAVGYGVSDEGKQYWIVKNSWGEEWGEEGYIKMIRNFNLCGIARQACYPLVEKKPK